MRKLNAAIAILAAGLVAAPAACANHLASGRDAAGDAAHADPARDITALALSYDRRSGTLRGGVALRAAPTGGTGAFLSLSAGVRTRGGCDGYPAIALSSFTTDPAAQWTLFDASGPPAASGAADKDRSGELQTFDVTDAALAGRSVDCVTAILTDPADPSTVYDRAGPVVLEPLPELAAALGPAPSALAPGRTRTVRVTLRNPGDAPTGRIRLAIGRVRGLTASVVARRTAEAALKAGQRRTVRIRVTLTSRARLATPLRVTATAGRLRVRDQATLYVRKPPKHDRDDEGSGLCASYAPVVGGIGDIVTFPC